MLLESQRTHWAKTNTLATFDAGVLVNRRCIIAVLLEGVDRAHAHRRTWLVLRAAVLIDHKREVVPVRGRSIFLKAKSHEILFLIRRVSSRQKNTANIAAP